MDAKPSIVASDALNAAENKVIQTLHIAADVVEQLERLDKCDQSVVHSLCKSFSETIQEIAALLAPLLHQDRGTDLPHAHCALARARADIATRKLQLLQSQLAHITQAKQEQSPPAGETEAMQQD